MTRKLTPRFIAWGELLWDIFPDQRRLGGAAANAAYHAARLGAEALLVSRVGADELGALAAREMSERGVDVRAVQVDDFAATGSVRVEISEGEPRYTIAPDAAWDHIAWTDDLSALLRTADVICFGTLAQRGPLGFDALERALSHAPPDALRICDLNLRPPFATRALIDRALELSRIVKLNESELTLVGQLFREPDVITWLLGARRMTHVAVTRGALVATSNERCEQQGFPLSSSAGDAVGAGDAFSATLALELWRGSPLCACLEASNRYAAQVASHAGGMPSAELYKY